MCLSLGGGAEERDQRVRTKARRVDYACKGSTVESTEPTSEGLCGAGFQFEDQKSLKKRFEGRRELRWIQLDDPARQPVLTPSPNSFHRQSVKCNYYM